MSQQKYPMIEKLRQHITPGDGSFLSNLYEEVEALRKAHESTQGEKQGSGQGKQFKSAYKGRYVPKTKGAELL